ncbi:protein kinase [Streptomyces sp. NPDC048506]|uniref:protein kinase domain-containing protein n=1 Tax=Streptomyces sp. NPDC048506 TaxID=3155028 RepID=UPI003429CD95
MEAGASVGALPGPQTSGVPRLGNRYELRELLGRGGTAEVHAAHDLRLDRGVAVKTLRSDLVGDPESLARFRREARSAASLNHPSIVAVYDTGEDLVGGAHVPYIVMERVDGATFADLRPRGERLPPGRALELTAGVLAALAYAHRGGIVHSDIKPANVMLTRDGAVKVTDFGIARLVEVQGAASAPHTTVVGTPPYLSPEQARGEAVGAPADLYSTGCLLYELLTGRPPFLGDGVIDLVLQHVEATPEPPSAHVPALPPACDALVLRALNKAPGDRHRDAEAMLRDVERVLAGLSPGLTVPGAGHGGPAHGGASGAAPASRSPDTASPGLHTAPTQVIPTADPTQADLTQAGPTRVAPAADPTLVFPAADPPVAAPAPGRRRDPRRRRGVRTAALLGSGLAVLAAVLAGGYALTVADAAGAGDREAGAAVSDAGSSSSPAPEPPKEPSSGERPPGEGASGPRTVQVPDLLGRRPAQARAAAERAGLRMVLAGHGTDGRCRQAGPEAGVEAHTEASAEVRAEAGAVCAQAPEPGTDVARGATIRVKMPAGHRRTHHRLAHR